MSRYAALAFLLLIVGLPSALPAQRRTIPAGARVRVVFVPDTVGIARPSRDVNPVIGELIGADDTSIVIMPPSPSRAELRVSLTRAARLDVYEAGAETHTRRGALAGLSLGAALGFLFGATAPTECECPAALGSIGGVVFGLGGLVVGAAVGSVIPRDGWRPVSLPVRVGPQS